MIGLYCRVYISEDDNYGPIYEGMMEDIPWFLMDYKIGRHDADEYSDAPYEADMGDAYLDDDEYGYQATDLGYNARSSEELAELQ